MVVVESCKDTRETISCRRSFPLVKNCGSRSGAAENAEPQNSPISSFGSFSSLHFSIFYWGIFSSSFFLGNYL
jgi:hypothetical protein